MNIFACIYSSYQSLCVLCNLDMVWSWSSFSVGKKKQKKNVSSITSLSPCPSFLIFSPYNHILLYILYSFMRSHRPYLACGHVVRRKNDYLSIYSHDLFSIYSWLLVVYSVQKGGGYLSDFTVCWPIGRVHELRLEVGRATQSWYVASGVATPGPTRAQAWVKSVRARANVRLLLLRRSIKMGTAIKYPLNYANCDLVAR